MTPCLLVKVSVFNFCSTLKEENRVVQEIFVFDKTDTTMEIQMGPFLKNTSIESSCCLTQTMAF